MLAQLLYLPKVNINGTLHNVVYAVTEYDQAYAFDDIADSLSGIRTCSCYQRMHVLGRVDVYGLFN